jgi:WD40 repeat protein
MKDLHKCIVVYKNDGFKTGSKLKLGHSGAQRVHYQKHTQTILLTGNNELPVYQIDPKTLDLSLLEQLEGHQSIITSVADLDDGFVVSGDDRGSLRIWDLNHFRCQQVLKVGNTLTTLECFQGHLIFADSRLNLLHLEQLKQKVPLKEQYGLWTFYDLETTVPEIYIFTNVACRVYNLLNGQVTRIIELCSS